MKHITIKQLSNGYIQLTPDKGYMLYNNRTKQMYSKAVVKDVRNWTATPKPESND